MVKQSLTASYRIIQSRNTHLQSYAESCKVITSTRVVHRCVRTNISAIPDRFGEMNEIWYIKHA